VPCAVSGEVLVGAGERLTVDGWGWRARHWGRPAPPRPWLAGRLDDGRWLAPGADAPAATVTPLHAAPLMDGSAKVLLELCRVREGNASGAAWRLTPGEL
ncbi:MAG TPA: hypothetical protein VK848_01530, partial [Acidimicrobiia bacterium]|nr:hypothetical protein [Acidimicrobiia bacterium]